jgi:hypothetical protein
VDLTADLRFILADVPGSVLVQCGAQQGQGMLTQASKLVEHRYGDLELQGSETVLIFDPTQLSALVKGCALTAGSVPYTVHKPVKLRADGSALATLVPA